MKRKGIILVAMLMVGISMQAVVYKLEKVQKIVSGEKYVLVQNGYTPYLGLTDLNGGYWLKKNNYQTEQLTGDEDYVWTFQGTSNNYQLINGILALKRTTGNLFVFDGIESGSIWNVAWEDGQAVLSTTSGEVKYIGRKQDTQLSLYGNKSKSTNNTYFDVYHLVAETYDRELSKMNIGTICLPYAVDKVTGAEVYALSYVEKDKEGKPYQVYYEQVEGNLEAGKPYIFVPSETTVKFQRADQTTVTKPVPYNGFYGTFDPIEDAEAGNEGNKLEGMYLLSGNKFVLCTDYCQLGANRGYFDLTQTTTTKPAPKAQQRMLMIGPDGVEYIDPTTTSVQEAKGEEKQEKRNEKKMVDGKLRIGSEGKWYGVRGDRL